MQADVADAAAKKGLDTFEGVTEPDADDDCESDGDMTEVPFEINKNLKLKICLIVEYSYGLKY